LLTAAITGGFYALENRRHVLLAQAMEEGAASAADLSGLPALVEMVRARAEMRAATAERAQPIFKEAESLWSAANAGAASGGDEAAAAALKALRYYMASLLWREGMVFIPDGEVILNGAPVFVPAFLIDDTEVTAGQFAAFCQDVPGGWHFPEDLGEISAETADFPITHVTNYDAAAFAAWKGKLLPTEAQWARAAYGYPAAAPSAFPWGAEWKPGAANEGSVMSHPARIKAFDQDRTQSVCYDMAGNVSEWTRTPVNPEDKDLFFGTEMIVCGGHFEAAPALLSQTSSAAYENRAATLGFRCVMEIPTAPEAVQECLRRI